MAQPEFLQTVLVQVAVALVTKRKFAGAATAARYRSRSRLGGPKATV